MTGRPSPDSPTDSSPGSRRVPLWVAVGFLVLVNLMWGISFPLTKTINLEVDELFGIAAEDASTSLRLSAATWLMLFRFTLALVLFFIFFPNIVKRATTAEWKAGFQIGVFFFVGLVLQIIALATIPASRSGFLTSLVAVFTPLLTAILLRQRPHWPVIVGVVTALAGVSILTGLLVWDAGGARFASDARAAWTTGDTLTTLAAVFFAGQIMLVDYHGKRLDAAAMTPGMFATTAVLSLVTFLVARPMIPETATAGWFELAVQPRFWTLIVTLSVLSSVLAFNWMNTYQHYVSASQAGIIYTLEPVFASAAAMVLPGLLTVWSAIEYKNEVLVWPMVIGGSLIVAANLVSLCPRAADTSLLHPPESEPATTADNSSPLSGSADAS